MWFLFSLSLLVVQGFWVWWAALTTYIIPTIVIFSLWLLIALELKRTKQNPQQMNQKAQPGKLSLRNRTLINITVITLSNDQSNNFNNDNNISLAFFIYWLPYVIAFISGEFTKDGMLSRKIVLPGYLNSLINPVLYIFLNTTIRKKLI